MKFTGLTIGIPKEILAGERRVAVTPETAAQLVKDGARVLVQKGAGLGAYISDDEYRAVGAEICSDVRELVQAAQVVLKVKQPAFNVELGVSEVELLREGQVLITFLHPAAPANHGIVQELARRGVIALTLDSIPRISRAQTMDALTSMSTVAGYKAVISAANRLPKFLPMLGTAVGMVQPAQVVVIGAGVAGLQAIATAKRLGAVTKAADVRPDAAEQAKSLGARIIELPIPSELAIGEGGYAKLLPEEWLKKEQEAIAPAVSEADIVILSALVPGHEAPVLVTQEMVETMRPGSVIVDISIDQGGNCALARAGEIIEHGGVVIDGTQNIPGTVPVSATMLFAKNVLHFVSHLVHDGKVELNLADEIIAASLVTHNGQIVHSGTLEAMRAHGEGAV
ncbi:MAG TPA: NAD(P) transhydrogenase subunit alpha [Firmicutes bacterium]|jgi:NAD(P) transhydrogenase subunit alpha|nr:MAG: NADP oxidoreductase [Peptococcaceae bacterium 1109]HHT73662.1 NAD(P) transhydrogenase subunit alpha [Bacillota bacterium]